MKSSFLAICAGVVAVSSAAYAQEQTLPPLQEVDPADSSVGYPTVAAAWADLNSRTDLQRSQDKGWKVLLDEKARTIWTFSPEGAPYHPTVVKRVIVPRGDESTLEMGILCEASKEACDDIVRSYVNLNKRVLGG